MNRRWSDLTIFEYRLILKVCSKRAQTVRLTCDREGEEGEGAEVPVVRVVRSQRRRKEKVWMFSSWSGE